MRRTAVSNAAVVGLLLATSALNSPVASQDNVRSWLPAPVASASYRDVDGSIFGTPSQIARALGGGMILVDAYENAVFFLMADGRPRWRAGRRGAGPGEFEVIQDLDVTRGGNVLVLDRKLARVTVIDGSSGEMIDVLNLPQVEATELIPTVDSRLLALVEFRNSAEEGSKRPWLTISPTGERLSTFDLPVACRDSLPCETIATGAGSAGAVVAFRWSSKLLFLAPDGSVRAEAEGVERISFPEIVSYAVDPVAAGLPRFSSLVASRVDPKATEATRSVSADEYRTFVLTIGGTENRGRIVDVYATADAEYLGSYLFPSDVSSLAILSDGRLATLTTDLFSEITLWSLFQ